MNIGLSVSLSRATAVGEPNPISATSAPSMAAMDDTQTPSDGFTSGTYSSTAGTISSEVVSYFVNGVSQLGNFDLSRGDVVSAREVVTDSAGNTRGFATGSVLVPWLAPAASGGLADVTFTQGSGVQTVDAAADFISAEGGSWSVTGAGATISDTGQVSIPTAASVTGASVVVTYTNSTSSASSGFSVTVQAAGWAFTGSTVDTIPSQSTPTWAFTGSTVDVIPGE